LHDALTEAGFDSIVTPPSLVPRIGGQVKTERQSGAHSLHRRMMFRILQFD